MARKLTTTEARTDFLQVLAEVEQTKQRFIIMRRGKAIAAIVPESDLARIEQQEVDSLLPRAKRLIAQVRNGKEKTTPIAEAAERLAKNKS